MQVTLRKWGNSNGIRIPKNVMNQLHLEENQKFVMVVENDSIRIKPKRRATTFEELFEDYEGDYKPEEFNWGKPVGREVW